MRRSCKRALVTTLLGTAIFLVAPMGVQAAQGKWWTPKESGRGGGQRAYDRTVRAYGPGGPAGQQPMWRADSRYGRVYRDYIEVRDGDRGTYFRARRFYVRPTIYGRVYIVHPVRYLLAAGVRVGGLVLSAQFHPRDYDEFGCNFCGERFGTYDAYGAHVSSCPNRPDGYRIQPRSWDEGDATGGPGDEGWHGDDE